MLKNRKLPDEDVILETMPTQIFQYKSLKEGEAKGIYINLKGKEHLVFHGCYMSNCGMAISVNYYVRMWKYKFKYSPAKYGCNTLTIALAITT